jgi:large subunit ribosomal protein L13
MLPWKKTTGREAFRRVRVYIGVPDEYQGKELTKVDGADASQLRVPYLSISQLSEEIGGRKF